MIRKPWFLFLAGAALFPWSAGCDPALTGSLNDLSEAVTGLGETIENQPPPEVNVTDGDVIVNPPDIDVTINDGDDGDVNITPPPADDPDDEPTPQTPPTLPEGLIAWIGEDDTGLEWTLTLGVWDNGFTEGFEVPEGWSANIVYVLTLVKTDGTPEEVEVPAEEGSITATFTVDPDTYDPLEGCIDAALVLTYTETGQAEEYEIEGGCR